MDQTFLNNAIIACIGFMQTDESHRDLGDLIRSTLPEAEEGEGFPVAER